jgi:hypothetical protein
MEIINFMASMQISVSIGSINLFLAIKLEIFRKMDWKVICISNLTIHIYALLYTANLTIFVSQGLFLHTNEEKKRLYFAYKN